MRIGRLWILHRQDITGRSDNTLYLRRWYLFRCPWFSLMLHKFYRPDEDLHLHDHPFSFVSFVLRGSYSEIYRRHGYSSGPDERRLIDFVAVRRKGCAHRIVELWRVPTWTLVFTGPRKRLKGTGRGDWGFYTENGWVPWWEYLS